MVSGAMCIILFSFKISLKEIEHHFVNNFKLIKNKILSQLTHTSIISQLEWKISVFLQAYITQKIERHTNNKILHRKLNDKYETEAIFWNVQEQVSPHSINKLSPFYNGIE